MNFSETFKQTNYLSNFSPNGQFVAAATLQRLIIRDVKSLKVVQIFTCLDEIEKFEWAPDSCYILCSLTKRRIIQVWSLVQPEWVCKIDEGSLGILHARWSPDSRHILTTSKFHMKITIWSLITKSASFLKFSKSNANPYLAFSSDGKYLALAERRNCNDHISIIECENWLLTKHFPVATKDLAGLSWSPTSSVICVWESLTEEFKVFCYFLNGSLAGTYSCPSTFSLGIKRVTWSPTGQFLAVGGYNQKVLVLNNITWKSVLNCTHSSEIVSKGVVAYVEKIQKQTYPSLITGDNTIPQSKYEVLNESVINIPTSTAEQKANPKIGIGTVSFSANGQYLATINDNMPSTLWIWNIAKLALSDVLIHAHAIKNISWDPFQTRLALATCNNSVYLWTPSGCLSVDIPCHSVFSLCHIKWHPHGDSLLLQDKDNMCLCFLTN